MRAAYSNRLVLSIGDQKRGRSLSSLGDLLTTMVEVEGIVTVEPNTMPTHLLSRNMPARTFIKLITGVA